MIKQVVGSVAATVIAALILYKLGINVDGEPIRVPSPSDEAAVPHFAPTSGQPLRLEVRDHLAFDEVGWGQLREEVMLTVGEATRVLRLTRNQSRGALAFHVPRPGRYRYLLRVTTQFNDHGYAGHAVPCTHVAERRGTVDLAGDQTLSLVGGFDQQTGEYQVSFVQP